MSKNSTGSILRGMLLVIILAALMLPASPRLTRAQEQQNLLKNGSFENGWYDVSGTQQCPDGWRMHWTEGEKTTGGSKTVRPESRVLPKGQVPPDEHNLYFWDGNYTVKIFWSDYPIHVAMSQDVSGLEVGREYKFVVPVYVDTFDWDEEEHKKKAPGPHAAQVRLGAGPKGANWRDEEAINFSNWANGASMPPFFLTRTTLQFKFVATASEMTVFVEYTSKWGLDNNGIFMDALRLEPLGMAHTPTPTPPPPPPTATPGPSPTPLPTPTPRPDGAIVHVVEEGDTLFALAYRYDVPVEQIRELNNLESSDLLRVGQELVISIPDEAPTSPASTAPAPTASVPATTATSLPQPPTSTPAPVSPTPEGASICVLAFHDRNGDTFRNPENEELLPNAEFTLADASGVLEKYTTDGVNEPHCFTELEPGPYRVIQNPPIGYKASGLSEQNVALAEGTSFEFKFGNTQDQGTGSSEETAEPTPTSGSDDGESGSTFNRVLTTVAQVAGVLVLIVAGAIAVLFVLSQRRRY